jgi:hypothetical protein
MNYQQIVTFNAHGSREKEIVVDPTSQNVVRIVHYPTHQDVGGGSVFTT